MMRFSVLISSFMLLAFIFSSCEHDPELPVVKDGIQRPICFETQILPVITGKCSMDGCHDGNSQFSLRTYNEIRSKIKPGDPNGSDLYKAIVPNRFTRQVFMPPKDKHGLDNEQITLIELWILEETNSFSKVILPLIKNKCAVAGCHVGQDAPNGVELTNFLQIKSAVDNNNLIKHITADPDFSLMPPDTNLYDSYVQKINKWVSDGFPNN